MRFILLIAIVLFISCKDKISKPENKIKSAISTPGSGSSYPLTDFYVNIGEDSIKGIYVDTSNKGLVVSFSITCNATDNVHGKFETIHDPSTHHCDSIKLYYDVFPSGSSKKENKVVANLYYRFTDVLSYRKSTFVAIDKSLKLDTVK